MAKKIIYILTFSIILEICKSSAQVSFTCSKEDKASILMDTANDFIIRAKDSNPTCLYDIYHFIKRRKYSTLLETATKLISTAKNACASDAEVSYAETSDAEAPDAKAPGAEAKFKILCYFASWAFYRHGDGKFEISHIDPYLCTHIVYIKATIHNNRIESRDPYLDLDGPGNINGYKIINDLKQKNPNLKTLLAISDDDYLSSTTLSSVAADQTNRTTFVRSVVPFLKQYGFDGLQLDWFPQENENFLQFLQDLKASLKPQGLLLAAVVPYWIHRDYDIPAVSNQLDLLNLGAHNYGYGETKTVMNAPLYASADDVDNKLNNVNLTVNFWLKNGFPKEKIILELGLYGVSFTLADTTQHGLGAPVTGSGRKGPLLDDPIGLGFNEICLNIVKESWTSVFDWESRNYYAYKGDQWVSYEDIESINNKIDYMIEKGLAGVQLPLQNDDFRGNCYGRKYPLLNAVASRLVKEC